MSYHNKPSNASSLGLLGDVAETIKIQHTIHHVFTFHIGDKWERPLRRSIDKFLDLSLYYAESFRFVAVGIGSFFFLWGVSKVVEAGKRDDDDDDRHVHHKKRSTTKKSSSQKDADHATVVTQSSRTTTGRSSRRSRRTDAGPPGGGATTSHSPAPPTTIAFESIEETAQEDGSTR
jgi:hypothetical protein